MELYLASPLTANIVQGFLAQGLIGAESPGAEVLERLQDPRAVLDAYSGGMGWETAALRFFGQVVSGLEAAGLSRSRLRNDSDSDRHVFETIAGYLGAQRPVDSLAGRIFEGLRQYVVHDPLAASLLPFQASDLDYGRRRLLAWPDGLTPKGTSFEISAYATQFYRRFSRPVVLDAVTAHWDKETGRVRLPEGKMDGVTSVDPIAEHVGARLRGEAIRSLGRAMETGLEFSNVTFPQYLAQRHPGSRWTKIKTQTAEEANVYFVSGASGNPLGVVKFFKGRPWDPFAADQAFDQLLALIRCQQALDAEGIREIRYARVYAAGTGWIFREMIPEEGFRLDDQDFASLCQWALRFEKQSDATWSPEFRLMRRVLWTSVGGEVRGRNVAKLNDSFVIYDPI